jgi:hypothetical protein
MQRFRDDGTIVSALRKRRIPGSRSALSRFFIRHGITIKKKFAGGRAEMSRRSSGAPTLDSRPRVACPARLVFIDETAVTTNMVRLNGWNRAESAWSEMPDGEMGKGDVYRWPASNWHRGADADQRSYERRNLPGLHGAMSGADARARDIVVIDNVSFHKVFGVEEAIQAQPCATCRSIRRSSTL